jgi:hypothetical protein
MQNIQFKDKEVQRWASLSPEEKELELNYLSAFRYGIFLIIMLRHILTHAQELNMSWVQSSAIMTLSNRLGNPSCD